MDLRLAGRIALVVGASGLIGRETARQLKDEGATVIASARPSERLDAVGAELGVETVAFDATDAADVHRAIDDIYARHGRIDALVVTSAPAAQTLDASRDHDPEQILAAIDGKALSFLRVADTVGRRMAESGGGRIVGISGQNARVTLSVTGALRNVALITAAKILADSYVGTGVSVNVVNPGPVQEEAKHNPEIGQSGDSTPEEVAALVVFLASPVANAVSGESVAVGHKVRGFAG